jgi:Na+/melibiose symporter-like transporter
VSSAVGIATVLANGTFLLVSWLAPGPAFAAWGWRIPFAVGALVLVLAWYIHRTVEETPEYQQAAAGSPDSRRPLRTVLRKHGGTVALAAASFLLLQSFFYIQVTGLLDYTTRVLHMPRQAVLTVVLIGMTFVAILTPVFASLSDRIGRLRVYVLGAVALGVWAFPYFLLVDTANILHVGVAVVVGAIFASILGAPQPALFAELFETSIRYTGSSVAYQASSLVGGGLTPFVMVLLIGSTGTSLSISIMLGVLASVTVVCVALLRSRVAPRTAAAAPDAADAAPDATPDPVGS